MKFNCQLATKLSLLAFSFVIGSFTLNAQSGSVDSDGDGIINSIDLDDDNDGILDEFEYAPAYCNASPSCITNASLSASAQATSTAPSGWTNFANGGNPDISQGNWHVMTNQVTSAAALFPYAPVGTYFIYGMSKNGSGAVGGWAPYGEAFSQTLTCLIPGNTYTVSFKGALTRQSTWNSPWTIPTKGNFVLVRDGATVATSQDIFLEATAQTITLSFMAVSTSHTITIAHTNPGTNDLSLMVIQTGTGFFCTGGFNNTVDIDTDGDGISNRFDLDSDGDGCSDAFEGGATIVKTDSLMTAPFGANGFANNKETATESGVLNYTNIYSSYAKSASSIACVDSDNDGIVDVYDIDDDNDGIPDDKECVISAAKNRAISSFTINNYFTQQTGCTGNNDQLWYTSMPYYKIGAPNDLCIAINGVNITDYVTGSLSSGTILAVNGGGSTNGFKEAFSYTETVVANRNYNIKMPYFNAGCGGQIIVKINGNVVYLSSSQSSPNFGEWSTENISWYSGSATSMNVSVEVFDNGSSCNDYLFDDMSISSESLSCDVDGDGVPNRLDLDSDGDGCYDAFEAGSSLVTTDSIIAGPYGTNGLANSKETSTDNGILNFVSNYNTYAISSNIAICGDLDGDGILDMNDIDDDNDGIIDAVESPSCFFAASNWFSGSRSHILSSTTLPMHATYNRLVQLTDGNNGLAVADYAVSFIATTAAAKTVYAFDMSVPVEITKLYIGYVNTNTHFNAGTFLKLQGSNDNATWTNLNDSMAYNTTVTTNGVNSIYGLTGTINANVFPVTKNSGKYRYYRIYWTNGGGININGFSNEIYIENPTNYVTSLNPSNSCNNDIDSDGKFNHFDLDSDGDGCSDAKEAGATTSTTANFKFTGAMGTNGLANALETSVDNGNINYTSSYQNAIDATKNGCPDFDGDGIGDLIDMDDDNDGVLDEIENNCTPLFPPTNFGDKGDQRVSPGWEITQSSPDIADVTNHVYGVWNSGCTSVAPAAPNGHTKWVFISSPTGEAFKTTINGLIPGQQYTLTYYCGRFGGFGFPVGQYTFKMGTTTIDQYTPTVGCGWDTRIITFTPTATSHDFSFQATGAGNVGANISVSANAISKLVCDFDNDGKPNSLDLDSDGDGCSDAFEAGATTVKTDSIIAGPYGANGYANSKETGIDNSQPNYNTTYNSFALSNTISLCRDTDGDGILDMNDIDDDNDGTLDAVESPTCFYTSSEWLSGDRTTTTVSTNLTMNPTYNKLAKLVDGENSTATAVNHAVQFIASTTSPSDIYTFTMPVPVELSKIYLGYINANTHFNAGTFLKLQGSYDNNIWTNLSDSMAYNTTVSVNGVTSIFGLTGTINANVFPVTKNAGKYNYYRIYWTNGGGINSSGISNEVYFETPTNYNVNLNPKPTCQDDNDGDGIKNHIDLDSDGDGCSDAKEAGATTSTAANFKFTGTMGTNGLDNSLETSVDNGTINYKSYYNNAIDNTRNGCLDYDNDGIGDLIDIDDDNDGILDDIECSPPISETIVSRFDLNSGGSKVSHTQVLTGFPDELWIDIWNLDNNLNLKVNGVNITTVSELNFANSGAGAIYSVSSTKLTLPSGAYVNAPNQIWNYGNNQSRPIVRIKIDKLGQTKIYALDGFQGAGNYQELVLLTASYQTVPINLTGTNTILLGQDNQFPPTYMNVEFNAVTNLNISDCDTDNDGIINSKDLDSDGDGCSDAFEAGATTVKTDSIIAGPYGSNGLANSKETALDNGTLNYSSTYSSYALSSSIGLCKDNDNDGILDLFDIDDDNDGVLDATESPSCFFKASEWFSGNRTQINTTTGLIMNTTYNSLNKLEDGDNGTAASSYGVIFNATTTSAPATVYNFDMSVPVEISKVYLGYANTNTHFNASTFLKLQGSNDNTMWTNLSDSLAYNSTVTTNGVTSIFGLPGTINANVFPVTKNTGKYRYYRIYWTNGGGINANGFSNEVYFETPSNYNENLNPKLACTEDKDLDGKLNHIDLDSDGDGCSDAKEAGATTSSTANYKFTGTMGTNGLDNSLETSVDNGTIKYVSYYHNAIDNTRNGCLDTDNDGIANLIDIDDDNDGVPDIEECTGSDNDFGSNFQGVTLAGYMPARPSSPTILSGPGSWSWPTSPVTYSNTLIQTAENGQYELVLSKSLTGLIVGNPITLISEFTTGASNCGASDTLVYEIDGVRISSIPYPTSFPFIYQASSILTNANVTISLVLKHGPGNPCNNDPTISRFNYSSKKECDSDNDGIPNSLDLDSDNDGCTDAFEAGSTTNLTDSIIAGPYGTNGLANSKETSVDNGTINYGSNYVSYAIASNIATCKDNDNDGILDINDIDDDNDGILDATESPSCFFTASEWVSENRPHISASSSLATNANYNKFSNLDDGDNSTAAASYAIQFNGSTTAQQTVYNFDMSAPVQISKLFLGYANANTHFNANTFLKLQGSNDNNSWTNLSDSSAYNTTVATNGVTSIFGVTGTVNANVFPVTKNSGKYRYYRIYWTNGGGINANGYSNEAYFELPSNYNANLNPKLSCSQDADMDGKLNHLDLDSDGDGCSDAKEAGSTTSTTANFKFTGTMGANGLDNSLETSVDNGSINYVAYYINAINSKLNGCTDTDGDGISDLIDIDDDNDGVIDDMETGSCSVEPVCTTFPPNSSFGITSSGCLGWTSINGNFDFYYPYNGKPMFDHQGSANPLYGLMRKTYRTSANVGYSFTLGLFSGSFLLKDGITPILRAVNATTGATITTMNLNPTSNSTLNFTAVSDSTRIEVGYPTVASTNTGNIFWYPLDLIVTSNCGDIDTDGDSIPNRLDTDSDGDGCSDALEAGATTSTTANFTFPGPYGVNGLADAKETSVDNGIINYGSNYAPYAISANIASCRDNDGDGIMDFVDVDDDNDGVLDATESPSCFFNASEWLSGNRTQITASTGLAMNATYNRLNLLEDGDNTTAAASYAVQFNATTTAPAVVYAFDMNVPVEINRLYLGYINTNTHFNANTFLRLQGSNDNMAWTSLNDSLAYNTTTATNGATAVPGVSGSVNANIFPVTKNSGKYRYYRILWSSGGGININGYSNEVYFETPSTYNANLNPKATCTEDVDNDKKYNHLDTDSDGDGCSDALEAGATTATTANFTFAAPYGANGLADAKETSVDNGIVNYNVTYDPYATSYNLAICKDSDNDGVSDIIDIDDDNDGILDAVESPSCFYASSEWLSGDRTTTTVSTNLAMNATYNSPAKLVDGNNDIATANYAVQFNATTTSPAVVYTFTMPVPVELRRIYLGYINTSTHFNAGTFLKLQGSNNNSAWTDLSDSIAYNTTVSIMGVTTIPGVTGTNNANIFPVNKKQGIYKYYRIYWTNGGGINATGNSNEVYFETPTTYNQSLNPKPSCAEDVDGDGIYNHYDLDSDGDSCSDALEGNSTASKTANFTFSGPYGTNGLANSLETQTDNGTVNYTSTYKDYAKSKTIKTCLDSDGDGIPDYIDIDDDNDGVLDISETMSCDNSDYTIDYEVDNGTNPYTNCSGSIDGPGANFYGFTLAPYTGTRYMGFHYPEIMGVVIPSSSPMTPGVPYKVSVATANASINAWNSNFSANMDVYAGTASCGTAQLIGTTTLLPAPGNVGSVTPWKNDELVFTPNAAFTHLTFIAREGVTGSGNRGYLLVDGLNVGEYMTPAKCEAFNDTDGDGKPNSLDTDSDGDGCSDAYEAGATTSTTANYVFAGPYGNNGLANSKETIADNGIINYSSTYSDYGLDKNTNSCADTDGDGIKDIVDIDDDNDGITDIDESVSICGGGLVRPTAAVASSIYPGSPANFTIEANGLTGNGLSATVSSPGVLADNWLMLHPQTTGYLEYTMPSGTSVSGVALWAPDILNYGGGDAPLKDFTVTVTYDGGKKYTSQMFTTLMPTGSGSLTQAQIFNLTKSFNNVTSIRLNISAGWYDVNNDNTSFVSTSSGVAINGAYNMTLAEFRTFCSAYTDQDSDNDGIPNRLDLDSDNDGCSDAYEGGSTTSTTANYKFTGTMGTNGLDNSKETLADNGVINYSLSYGYAIDSTTKSCVDSDGDGIKDIIDLDDDNDGVLDTEEYCQTPALKILFAGSAETATQMSANFYAEFNNNKPSGAVITQSNIIESANVPAGFYDGYDMVVFGGGAWATYHQNHWDALEKAIKNKTSKAFVIQSDNCCNVSNRTSMINLLNSVHGTNYSISGAYESGPAFPRNVPNSYSQYFTSAQTLLGEAYYAIAGVASSDILYRASTNATLAFAGMKQLPGTTDKSRFLVWYADGTPTQAAGWYNTNQNKMAPPIYEAFSKNNYIDCDTDGDGIPNRLDTDSDNDGCSDAFEASATKLVTPNYTFPAPYGTNGYADAKETTADNGIANYVHTYANARDSSTKFCLTPDFSGNNGIEGNILNLCQQNGGSRQLVATPTPANSGAIIKWYAVSTGGTGSTTAPTVSLTNTGMVSYWATQTLNGSEGPRAEIVVRVNAYPALPTAIFGATSVDSNSVNIHSVVPVANASGYIWTLPSGWKGTSTSNYITDTAGSTGGVIYVKATNNGCNSDSVILNVNVRSAKPNISNNKTIYCQNDTAVQLVAVGSNLKWYTSPTTTTFSTTAPTPTTVVAGSYSYFVSQTVNGNVSDRAEIIVTVNPIPAQPGVIVGPTAANIGDTVTYFVTGSSVDSGFVWTKPSTWTYLSTNTNKDTIRLIIGSPNAGEVSVVKKDTNSCSSLPQKITIKPAGPNTNGNTGLVNDTIKYCQGTTAAKLTASLNPINNGGKIYWYTTQTGGTGDTTAPTPSTVSAGTTTYWVGQTVNGVESDRSKIVVVVNPIANQPNPIVGSTTVTSNTSYTYSVTAVVGATSYTWTKPNGWSGTSTTNSITLLTDTTSKDTITVTANIGTCSSAPQRLNISLIPLNPTAADSVAYCQNTAATALTASLNPTNNGGKLKWYTAITGGTGDTTAPTPSTLNAVTTYYYVSQVVNGAESGRTPVKVIVNPSLNQPNAILGATAVLSNTAYTYSVGAVSGATSYTWTKPNGWTGTSTTNTISLTTDTSTSGTITVVANGTTCSSVAQTLTVTKMPNNPISGLAGDSIEYCQNATATALTASLNPANNGGTLNWYTAAVGGTASTSAPTPSTLNPGTTYYYVSQTVNGIESGRTAIKVVVKVAPNQPNAIVGASAVSTNTAYTYNVTAVSGATSYTWTLPNGWTGTSTTNTININTSSTTTGTISVKANIGSCSSLPQTLAITTLPNNPTSGLVGDSIEYCQNATATALTASLNPVNNGGSLNWYTAASGGTASTTAPTPSTSVSGTTLYYVSQTVNGVESGRTAIKVVVKTAPNQPNAISGASAVSTNTAYTYNVTAVGGATSYTWTLPNGWTGTSTTNTININTSSTTTGTISVKANTGACNSAAQILSIGGAPAEPDLSGNTNLVGDSIVYCQNATATQLVASLNPANNGGTLNWYTSPTGGTASATAPTPSTSVSGITYYYISQTVNGIESNRKAIKVIVNPILSQPNTIQGTSAVLSNTSYTYSVSAVPGATSYTWTLPNGWSGISTTNTININTSSTTTGTISVKANIGACSSIPQTLTITTLPNNPISGLVGDSIVYCQNATATALTASLNPANNGGTLNWYTAASGGTASATAPTPSTSVSGTTLYYVSQTVNGVESGRTAIKVIVKVTPNQPNAISGSNAVSANTNYTYSTGAVTGATSYTWTLPNGWTGTSTTNTITINTSSTTTGTISVKANIGACSSAAQILSIGGAPAEPDLSGNTNLVGDSIVYCQNATTTQLVASLNPANNGGTLNWYTSPTGGTASATAPTPSTSVSGITYYYISQTVNGIESNRKAIKVIVNPILSQPNTIQGTSTVLSNTSYTYSVSAVPGATSYTWTLPNGWSGISTTNTININTSSTTTGTISVKANIGACSSIPQTLAITMLPNTPISGLAGDSIVYCQGASVIPLTASLNPANNGGTLNWYTVASGGTASASAPSPSTLFPGTTLYYVSQTVNGVESGRTAIKVIVNAAPNQPNAISGPTAVIANTNYSYNIGAVTGATSYTWTLPNGWTGTSTTNTININTSSTTSGTISVKANIGSCSSAAQTLSIGGAPAEPDLSGNTNLVGDSIIYCQNITATQLVASLNPSNNGGTLNWYTSPSGGTASAIAPTPSTTNAGTYFFYVSQTVNGVESARKVIKVIVKPAPNQPNAISGPASVSANTSYTYSITAVSGATSYTWTKPNGWIGTSNTNSITFTTDIITSGVISVTANVGSCSSIAQSKVVGTLPNNPTTNMIGDSTVYCQGATAAQLTANLSPSNNGGTLNWYTVASGGTASASAPTPSTLTSGTTMYYVSQTVGGVESNRTAIKVVVKAVPSQASLTTVQPSCAVNTATITVNAPINGAYKYSIDSVNYSTTTTFSGVLSGAKKVYVKDTTTGCFSSVLTTINVAPAAPANPTIQITQPSCQSATGSITISAPTGSNYIYSIDSINYQSNTNFTSVTAGTYRVRVKDIAANCATDTGTKAIINSFSGTPSQPGTITGPVNPTIGSTVVYSIDTVAGASSYTWTVPTGWNITSGQNTKSISVVVGSTGGTITVKANNNSGCSSAARSLEVNKLPAKPIIDPANTNIVGNIITYCQGTVATPLRADSTVSGAMLRWYTGTDSASASSAGAIDTGSVGPIPSTAVGNTQTMYWVSQTVNGEEGMKALIIVKVNPTPSQPNAIVGNTIVLAGSAQNYSVTAVPGAASYTWTLPSGWSGTSTTNSITATVGTLGGTIKVKANIGNCSSQEQTLNVNIKPFPVDITSNTNISGNTITYCQGVTPNPLTAVGISGSTLKWYDSDGTTVLAGAPTPSTDFVQVKTYYVSQIVNGVESDKAAINVKVNSAPSQPNPIQGDTLVTKGSTKTYTVSAVPGATSYTWTLPNGWTGTSSTNSITVVADSVGGVITVKANSANCSSPIQTITVRVSTNNDADGDGIPDDVEKGSGSTPRDTDGDGTPDYLDTDSDNDGIPDSEEDTGCTGISPCTPTDTDGDGTPDYRDLDSDGDGIPDSIEKGSGTTPRDTDGDGIPDYRDLDSDGDGIPDSIEKGSGTTPTDTDGDGTPDYRDLDSDGDGIPDSIEKGSGTTPIDTDGDGIPDYRDLDSDGDGIPDSIEKGSGTTPIDTDGDGIPDYQDLDSDNDGILDAYENKVCVPSVALCDTDGDGIPNYLDLDSDGDGIKDVTEANGTDANNDGKADGPVDSKGVPSSAGAGLTPSDTDGDGKTNPYDLDSDGDGIPDSVEKGSGNTPIDTDGDGKPDYLDTDSDGDGIPDSVEKGNGTTPQDTDGDGIPNHLDLDSDNDGILDAYENNVCVPSVALCDIDGDGIPNYMDLDSDNDGIPDVVESNGKDVDGDGKADGVSNSKGIPSSATSGNTPPNTDALGYSDPYDLDSDNDGILDSVEKGPNGSNPRDTDGDGIPDYRDVDSDGDGNTDLGEGEFSDCDKDGIPDYLDTDDCSSGIFPNYITPNGDGKNDKFVIPDSYLKKYPGAKLIIYNRWGNVVWRSVGAYQNDWAGTHYDNDNLPDGVYYYLIELKDNFGEIKNGFIQIMRD